LIDDDGDDESFLGSDAQLREFFGLDSEPEENDEGIDGSKFKPIPIETTAPSTNRRSKPPPIRNPLIQAPWQLIDEHPFDVSRLRVGKSIELRPQSGDTNYPQFLAIKQIARHRDTGEIVLHGLPINRVTALQGMVDGKLNEVYLELEEDMDDRRPLFEQAMMSVGLHEVFKLRNIKFTSAAFPELSFRDYTPLSCNSMTPEEYSTQKQLIKHTGVLVCRLVHITRYADAYERKDKARKGETILRRLCNRENPLSTIELVSTKEPLRKSSPAGSCQSKVAKIDYSSAFAGLGGDALGAMLAGLNVLAAFDQDEKSCLTFQKNFPRTLSYVQSANEMILIADTALPFSSIWHLSCPCQPWSAAHTRDGKNDWQNIEALFTVEPFLQKTKPLLVTLEQTAGIVSRHPAFFATLIRMLLSSGYNVRWKVVKFQEYGLASTRKRLIVYGVR
jgi:DNA (cytosine-5)-methyltransferase 1